MQIRTSLKRNTFLREAAIRPVSLKQEKISISFGRSQSTKQSVEQKTYFVQRTHDSCMK